MRKLAVLLTGFVLAGSLRFPQSALAAGGADRVFSQLADEYITGYLAWRPQTGTTLGLHQYDGKVTDFSKASFAAELVRLKSFDERLAQIDPGKLSSQSAYDYRILAAAIKRERFGFDEWQIYERNPMTYSSVLDVNIYIKRNFAPLENRVGSITSVLNQAPKIFAAARENLAETLPRPQIETAIEEANGAVDFLGKDLVAALTNVQNKTLMADFKAANQRAMDELRGYVTYLKEKKLPHADESYALGREKYAHLLQFGELVDLTPEELLAVGEQELKRKQKVFAETARAIDPSKEAVQVFKEIQKDHPTEKSLIPDTAKNLEMIRQFVIDHKIITLPSKVRAIVAETPQFLRATSFASMDTPGPFETKATEAYYYVTPVEPEWPAEQKEEWLTAFNFYTTDVVSIHEAYPGHYVQFLCLNASHATKIEKIFNGYAFVEGWAHYAEQMMLDQGFGEPGGTAVSAPSIKAAKYRLAQTDEALLRICRFCVSIKMHCQGMTVDQATKFFQDNCYYEAKPAKQEAIRGAYDPEFLYYTLGKMEIFKLRADYQKQEASKYSLQKFHDEFLRHGAPPIRLLRELMLKDHAIWGKTL
jgi:uncharacterized protein (DUF885 family)